MFKPVLLPEARRILDLARKDRPAARKAMAELSLDAQVALVCETPPTRREELLSLAPQPEQLIPELPPAELVFTAKAVGLHDAGWILEHASEEQIVACFDLDAWTKFTPDLVQTGAWIKALAEAGPDTLLRAARALDMELLVLELRSRARVTLKPNSDDWTQPDGSHTIDGQFFLEPLRDDDDFEDILSLLQALFQHDYWVYFRLLQGAQWELESDAEEWALRWRDGRLQDLGFPPLGDAKRIYAYLFPQQLSVIPKSEARPLGEWPLAVWMRSDLVTRDSELALFRALAAIPEPERRPHLFAFLALANRVAMADELPLGDAETLPASLEKAARLASRGLEHLARENSMALPEVLRRTPIERLFRVGHQLGESEQETGGGAQA